MSTNDTFGWYTYTSDDGNNYIVRMSAEIATQGGFGGGSSPLSGSARVWAWNYRDMRHVTGVNGAGKRGRLPIGQPGNQKLKTGGTWTAHGKTYTILGVEGERRPASHIGG